MFILAEVSNKITMVPEQKKESENKSEQSQEKPEGWIEKTEEFLDEAAEKIHNSESYKKVGKTAEKATLSLFRAAGRWWGKAEHNSKEQDKPEDK